MSSDPKEEEATRLLNEVEQLFCTECGSDMSTESHVKGCAIGLEEGKEDSPFELMLDDDDRVFEQMEKDDEVKEVKQGALKFDDRPFTDHRVSMTRPTSSSTHGSIPNMFDVNNVPDPSSGTTKALPNKFEVDWDDNAASRGGKRITASREDEDELSKFISKATVSYGVGDRVMIDHNYNKDYEATYHYMALIVKAKVTGADGDEVLECVLAYNNSQPVQIPSFKLRRADLYGSSRVYDSTSTGTSSSYTGGRGSTKVSRYDKDDYYKTDRQQGRSEYYERKGQGQNYYNSSPKQRHYGVLSVEQIASIQVGSIIQINDNFRFMYDDELVSQDLLVVSVKKNDTVTARRNDGLVDRVTRYVFEDDIDVTHIASVDNTYVNMAAADQKASKPASQSTKILSSGRVFNPGDLVHIPGSLKNTTSFPDVIDLTLKVIDSYPENDMVEVESPRRKKDGTKERIRMKSWQLKRGAGGRILKDETTTIVPTSLSISQNIQKRIENISAEREALNAAILDLQSLMNGMDLSLSSLHDAYKSLTAAAEEFEKMKLEAPKETS